MRYQLRVMMERVMGHVKKKKTTRKKKAVLD